MAWWGSRTAKSTLLIGTTFVPQPVLSVVGEVIGSMTQEVGIEALSKDFFQRPGETTTGLFRGNQEVSEPHYWPSSCVSFLDISATANMRRTNYYV